MPIPQLKPTDELKDTPSKAIGFILRLGRALHTYGLPANRLEEVMGKASEQLSLQGQFFSTPTSIFAAFGPQDQQHTFLIRISPGDVNLGKIAELDEVAVGVLRGSLDPAHGSEQIDKILSEPPRYGHLLMTIAYGLASACASRFLGGGLKEIAISAVIGLVIGLVLIATKKYSSLSNIFVPFAAFASSALAAIFSFVFGAFSVSNASLAGMIVLMPGLTLTVAMIELSTQHLSSGTARLSRAFVVFLGMGFGAAVGNSIIESIFGQTQIARATQLPGWTVILALLMMPLAFTILLRARLHDAVWIVIAGALAFGGSRIGVKYLGPELGVFVGALIVGIASSYYSHFLDRPQIITQVPGILLLVPGSVGFRGLVALLDEEVVSGIDITFKMILTAVALVAGTLIASIVAPVRREI